MDAPRLAALIEQLEPDGLGEIGVGRSLRLVDDACLAWGRGGEPDVLLADLPAAARANPQRWLLDHAATLIADYYRIHPLTRAGFDRQVRGLFAQHGAEAFTAAPGRAADFTLFVDEGSVVAEAQHDPRHRYGVYCELGSPLSREIAAQRAHGWLESGEAYETYLGMNVCRYNC